MISTFHSARFCLMGSVGHPQTVLGLAQPALALWSSLVMTLRTLSYWNIFPQQGYLQGRLCAWASPGPQLWEFPSSHLAKWEGRREASVLRAGSRAEKGLKRLCVRYPPDFAWVIAGCYWVWESGRVTYPTLSLIWGGQKAKGGRSLPSLILEAQGVPLPAHTSNWI